MSGSTGEGHGFRPGAVGFLTDTTLCIGCKACEVACKQWNQLPAEPSVLTGFSFDNTVDLGATTWRHVAFVEQMGVASAENAMPVTWLMLSDVCNHCVKAACMEACPTGAIICTEFDTVVIQQDICNGCGYCVPACPFGVPELSGIDGRVHKCTLCYDRLVDGFEPACAKSCPTDSIVFGYVDELYEKGKQRVDTLQERGIEEATLYGDRQLGGTGAIEGLNAMFVLTAPPETYNLPAKPRLPQEQVLGAFITTGIAAIGIGMATWRALRSGR